VVQQFLTSAMALMYRNLIMHLHVI